MTDFLAVTRASTATRDDLDALMALFGKPDTAREAALAALEKERRNAIQRTFALPKLAGQIDARAAVNAEYAARVAEVELTATVERELKRTIELNERRAA
jgi:hypothetical protein